MSACCGKKILVAEGNVDSRQRLRLFIQTLGHEVLEAGSSSEAIELALSSQPDLILMDLNMPESDCLNAILQIRERVDLSEIPIVANSSDGGRGIELFSNIDKFGPGRIEYIPRPFSFEGLGHQIDSILGAASGPEPTRVSAAT